MIGRGGGGGWHPRRGVIHASDTVAVDYRIAPNFREIAGNPMNINFCDKNFVIATFFCDCRRRAPLAGRIYKDFPAHNCMLLDVQVLYCWASVKRARKRDRKNKMTQFESQSCVASEAFTCTDLSGRFRALGRRVIFTYHLL